MGIALFLIGFLSTQVSGQLKLSVTEHFLAGESIKKIHISPDDNTVWVLTHSSKVFYKAESSPEFIPFPGTITSTVLDFSGYGLNDMFFQIGPSKILRVKNNIPVELEVPAQINGLGVVANLRSDAV